MSTTLCTLSVALSSRFVSPLPPAFPPCFALCHPFVYSLSCFLVHMLTSQAPSHLLFPCLLSSLQFLVLSSRLSLSLLLFFHFLLIFSSCPFCYCLCWSVFRVPTSLLPPLPLFDSGPFISSCPLLSPFLTLDFFISCLSPVIFLWDSFSSLVFRLFPLVFS